MARNRPERLAGDHQTVVKRTLPARREDVYAMWTNAERMTEWICGGATATLDVRVGGRFHIDMLYQGKVYPHDGEYLEVVPPERLVFTWVSEGTNWLPSIVTVELLDRGTATELVLTHEGLPDAANALSHQEGWTEIIVLLEKLVAAAIVVTEIRESVKGDRVSG